MVLKYKITPGRGGHLSAVVAVVERVQEVEAREEEARRAEQVLARALLRQTSAYVMVVRAISISHFEERRDLTNTCRIVCCSGCLRLSESSMAH